uniref:Putative secreted protein n=1 Tax=Anopheles triannulatus TaxID=58253 RepID=A0A2M4B5M8_9DIPT
MPSLLCLRTNWTLLSNTWPAALLATMWFSSSQTALMKIVLQRRLDTSLCMVTLSIGKPVSKSQNQTTFSRLPVTRISLRSAASSSSSSASCAPSSSSSLSTTT